MVSALVCELSGGAWLGLYMGHLADPSFLLHFSLDPPLPPSLFNVRLSPISPHVKVDRSGCSKRKRFSSKKEGLCSKLIIASGLFRYLSLLSCRHSKRCMYTLNCCFDYRWFLWCQSYFEMYTSHVKRAVKFANELSLNLAVKSSSVMF